MRRLLIALTLGGLGAGGWTARAELKTTPVDAQPIELGSSAAIAYMLLFTVTFFSMLFVNMIRHQAIERL